MQKIYAEGVSVLRESVRVYLALLKILVPAIIAVKILQELGAVETISDLLAPLMTAVGLPPLALSLIHI